jgi:hypothetical protein
MSGHDSHSAATANSLYSLGPADQVFGGGKPNPDAPWSVLPHWLS